MKSQRRTYDAVKWFMDELSARVIAKSGIPTDRYHLGKLIQQSFQDSPDFVSQIDGSTGKSETCNSVLKRSTNCASCFRALGLKTKDVIAIMSTNHLDTAIPLYAALYLGIAVSAVDATYGINELQNTFKITEPKIIFCESARATDVQVALNAADLNAKIVTFGKGDYLCYFQDFLIEHGDHNVHEDFIPANFDPEETISFLIPTSGTTGLPKAAAVTHKNLCISLPYVWSSAETFPTPTRLAFLASPLQWLTAVDNYVLSPILRYPRLQTSAKLTKEHFFYLVNTYKPSWTILSPTFLMSIVNAPDIKNCDLTCFDMIMLGGSAVPRELIEIMKQVSPNTDIYNIFGMTEITSMGFNIKYNQPWNSCGRAMPCLKYRLIDLSTGDDIYEPNVSGELWLKGPMLFKEYYNNPEATANTFAEDKWFKTGDLFYRDENEFYYFQERIKLLLKWKSYQISPIELESVIRKLPGILDVAVTGVPDPESGELPVACVVLSDGCTVTAQDIKDIVAENLSDSKKLRGGVIFLKNIPLTASSKVHRTKLKEIAMTMNRE